MKTIKLLFLALGLCALGAPSAFADVTRTFTDSQGHKVEATFIKLDGDTVYIQLPATGQTFALPMSRFSSEDQAVIKTLPPAANAMAMMPVPTDAKAADAAKKIDELVLLGLTKNSLKPNPLMSDEQFVRRVYLDVVGRIPSYEETSSFLKEAATDKSARGKLIDTLMDSEGYVSNMYNYFAEMLRAKDRNDGGAQFVRGLPYIQWIKEQLKANTPWDKMVYAMLTAEGKVWNNGAAGYLLRDSGMPLDNLANTLSVFLGTDVACAQCHDHPFSEWTQRQFYEMAAFFGATTTQLNRRDLVSSKSPGGDRVKELMQEMEEQMAQNGIDPKQYRNLINNVIGANRYVVMDLTENRTKLPMDYKYKDGKGGDPVSPKLIHWGGAKQAKEDERNPAYKLAAEVEKKSATLKKATAAASKNPNYQRPAPKQTKGQDAMNEGLRMTFAQWATHPQNPRFAMTIANRMWARAMGMGLTANLKNIDNPDDSYNPALLKHLASEMVRVKFNLKEFLKIVYNTQTYQREATTEALAMGMPYYFQGPVLRRMSAEQAWDSYMTLVLGSGVDKPKSTESDDYARAIDMDLTKTTVQTLSSKITALQNLRQNKNRGKGGGLAMAGKEMSEDEMKEMDGKVLSYGNMRLMRASELEQPAPAGHFLREFGQSERLLIDGGVRSGSVPQVLMMMNGNAQQMLTSADSLVHRTVAKQATPQEKVDALFLSILNRKPTDHERDIASKQVAQQGESQAFSDMIWALINTREFSFVQ